MKRMNVTKLSILLAAFALATLLVSGPQLAHADPLPPGSYLQNCQQPRMDGSTLSAVCLDGVLGIQRATTLPDADYCNSQGHDIADVNGFLRCIYYSDPGGWGFVSRLKDQTKGDNVIINWRIDDPYVLGMAPIGYGWISFKPGDAITIYAGGCVQTGGHGATWKSYTYPSGDNSGDLYSGTIVIPGVIPGPQRIAGALNRQWHVGDDLQPPDLKQLYLQLGYQDDGYGDNGYYAHDNGNNNQCLNVTGAYVEVQIVRSLKKVDPSDTQPWTPDPGGAPFDVVWDQIDTQGLPLNPRWFVQGEKSPQSMPDFKNTCGAAFSNMDTMNIGVLNQICTNQMPYMDLDTSPFVGWSFPGIAGGAGYCTDNGFLRGHLDWFIGTMTGTAIFGSWTTGTGEDDDYNMLLVRDDKSLVTTNEDSNVMNLEFNSDESVDQFKDAWWSNLDSTIHGLAGQNGQVTVPSNTPLGELIVGKPAVVIGLIGIDGVHGDGHTELHPVFALAIQTSATDGDTSRDETWAFFVRNFGNEGNCSENLHFWEGLSGKYYVQLPNPPQWSDVTNVTLSAPDAWLWAGSNEQGSPKGGASVTVTKDDVAAYLEVGLPAAVESGSNQGGWGINGEVTIHYALKAGGAKKKDDAKKVPERVAFTQKHAEEPEVNWDKIQKGITDAAVRQRVEQLLTTAYPAGKGPKHMTQHVDIDPKVGEHKPIPGVRKDQITRTVRARSELISKLNSDMKVAIAPLAPAKAGTVAKPPAK
jgi:hypothetical protein